VSEKEQSNDDASMVLYCVGTLLECFGHRDLEYSDHEAIRKLILLWGGS
jgi:hypothetical protein